MVSICLTLAIVALSAYLVGEFVDVAAKLVGSKRAAGSTGALVVITSFGVGMAGWMIVQLLHPTNRVLFNILALTADLTELAIVVVAVRWFFQLTWVRSLAPLAALLVAIWVGSYITTKYTRPYLVASVTYKGNTMEPTLQPGDVVFVDRVLSPRRWDLIEYKSFPNPDCARVVGLPGETITFAKGYVYANGNQLVAPDGLEGHIYPADHRSAWARRRLAIDRVFTLGDGEYYVIDDNLGLINDSHTIPDTDILGIIDARCWPLNHLQMWR